MSISLKKEVELLPYSEKFDFILSKPETELHEILKHLFDTVEKDGCSEITHGNQEYGRDLVIKRKDPYGITYIGVIVKKGDKTGKITGEAEGVITEIINQGKMSTAHPYFLKEIGTGSIKINTILVIFAGKLTQNASIRIENELDASTRIIAISDLIQMLESYYPEVFFGGEDIKFVKQRIDELEARRDFPAGSLPLTNAFVNPYVTKIESTSDIPGILMDTYRGKKLGFHKLEKVIETGSNILIFGDPGTGKSTALEKIALDMHLSYIKEKVKNRTKKGIEIPILIKAKDLVANGNVSIDNIVESQIPSTSIREQIKIKVLLIDGLDEVVKEKRSSILEMSEQFAINHSCSLVISTRKIDAIQSMISPFIRYELLPFEYDQAMRYINKFVKDKDLLKIIDEGLQRKDFQLKYTPMNLHLLIEIATSEKEIPASTAEIYERYTDDVSGRSDKVKGIESIFAYYIKKRFLAELAWEQFYRKNKLEIDKNAFDNFIAGYLKRHRYDTEKLDNFIEELQRAGILKIGEKVSFRHRSFLDYFCAYRLQTFHRRHKDILKAIIDIYFDTRWNDISFFFVGLLREITEEIIQEIDNHPVSDIEGFYLKVMIGRLIQAGWYSDTELKSMGISVGLKNIPSLRKEFDLVVKASPKKIPSILADFFVLFICEYAFGSRTMRGEILDHCNFLCTDSTLEAANNCMHLLWANRDVLSAEDIEDISDQLLTQLETFEKDKLLEIKDKFLFLFVLEQVQYPNSNILRTIKRKARQFRKVYKEDLKAILPEHKKGGFRN